MDQNLLTQVSYLLHSSKTDILQFPEMYLVFAYKYPAWQRLSEDRIPSSLEDEVSAA